MVPDHMLTVEIDTKAQQVFVHGNPKGLRYLAMRLEAIASTAEAEGHSHDHLMTDAWGGKELSGEQQGAPESATLINHLIVYGWLNR
jgi:hypothetical protein